jgi:hypothetical protein
MVSFTTGFKEILGQNPTRWDYAVVLIAAPIGFVADGVLTIHGLPSPGYASLGAASVALGVKRAVQPRGKGRRKILRRAVALMDALDSLESRAITDKDKATIEQLGNRLRNSTDLYKSGVTEPEGLEQVVADTVKQIDKIAMRIPGSAPSLAAAV